MLKTAESTAVAAEHLQLIDRVAGQIAPDDTGLGEWYRTYRREHTRRLAGDLAIATRLVDRSARLLEYGAVPLLMTAALSALGFRTSAVDLAPERFAGAIAALGLDVRRCDVEREAVPFDDTAFDVVLFSELFEHVRINPILTLREVRRVPKPGGGLILSTPNLGRFEGFAIWSCATANVRRGGAGPPARNRRTTPSIAVVVPFFQAREWLGNGDSPGQSQSPPSSLAVTPLSRGSIRASPVRTAATLGTPGPDAGARAADRVQTM